MTRKRVSNTHYTLAALAVLMAVAVAVVVAMTGSVTGAQREAVKHRLLATGTCHALLSGVNASMAALQSAVILGADAHAVTFHETQRRAAWEQIDEALTTFATFAEAWENTSDARRLEKLQPKLETLRTAQEEFEELARRPPDDSTGEVPQRDAPGPSAEVTARLTAVVDHAREAKGIVTEIVASQDSAAVADRERAADAESLLVNTAILSGLVLVFAGALFYSATEAAVAASKRKKRLTKTAEVPTTALAMRGTVKFFNTSKGFGFIEPADGGDDVFIHQNDIPGLVVQEGDRVEFDITQWEKGPRATNIKTVKGD